MTYATNTTVSPDRSRAEIERTLSRYGARSFAYGWDDERGLASIQFVAHQRRVRFMLPLPSMDDPEFQQTTTGRTRTKDAAEKAYDQAVRQRWRALALVVKAKLEAVSSGIVSFEEEFLAQIVLPDGRSVAEHALPAIEHAYDTGAVKAVLQIEG